MSGRVCGTSATRAATTKSRRGDGLQYLDGPAGAMAGPPGASQMPIESDRVVIGSDWWSPGARGGSGSVPIAGQTVRHGVVMPGVRVFDQEGEIVSEAHGNPLLPRSIAPGQSITIDLPCPIPPVPGNYTVKIDLVDQQICWFEDRGSQPLIISVAVDDKK
jgi:hypothetical protein